MKRAGQGLVEYILLVSLMSLVVLGGMTLTGENVSAVFQDVANETSNENEAGTPVAAPVLNSVQVLVATETGIPLSGLTVQAFDVSESLVGTAETNSSGLATVTDLPDGRYIFWATYAGQEYWSPTISAPEQSQTSITITELQLTVNVTNSQGTALAGVQVSAFNAAGDFTGKHAKTDQNGSVSFTLPAGSYQFRADYLAQPTWSDMVAVPDLSSTNIRVPVSDFTVTVQRANGEIMSDVSVYAFNQNEGYTGIKASTNQNGTTSMELPDGSYKFRTDYLGKAYWSETVTTPDVNSTIIYIGEYKVTVQLTDTFGEPYKVRQHIWTYNSDGDFIKLHHSNFEGTMILELPSGSYYFRSYDQFNQGYDSEVIQVPGTLEASMPIYVGQYQVTLRVEDSNGNLIPGRRHVWLYYGDGSFFKLVMTDNQGIMQLGLNAGSYRFLTHYPGNNRNWSEVFSVPETTNITIVTK